MRIRRQTITLKSVICKNGHSLTSVLSPNDTCKYKFCPQCGEELLMSCPQCKKEIPGGYAIRKEISDALGDRTSSQYYPLDEKEAVASFCPYCGKPYPWTEKFLKNYQLLLELSSDEINSDLKEIIYNATENLVKDKFSSESIQILILKKCFSTLSEVTKVIFVNAISNFAGDYIKKVL